MNAEKVQLNANSEVTIGYLLAAALCIALATMKLPRREKEADELALDAEDALVQQATKATQASTPEPSTPEPTPAKPSAT